MVEKRSETKAAKPRFNRLSFHSALPIYILYPSLDSLTRPMYVVRQRTVLEEFRTRRLRAQSNNSAQSDGFAAAGLNRYAM